MFYFYVSIHTFYIYVFAFVCLYLSSVHLNMHLQQKSSEKRMFYALNHFIEDSSH